MPMQTKYFTKIQTKRLTKEGKKLSIVITIAILLILINASVIQFPENTAGIINILFFIGFLIVAKDSKNIFLLRASQIAIISVLITIIALYFGASNNPLLLGMIGLMNLVVFVILGLAVFTIKKIGNIPKITGVFLMFYLIFPFVYVLRKGIEQQHQILLLLVALSWVFTILVTLTLYKYLQTMKRPRRRRRK